MIGEIHTKLVLKSEGKNEFGRLGIGGKIILE
jgi:hypothetical protein